MNTSSTASASSAQVKLTPGLPAHWGLLKQRLEKVRLAHLSTPCTWAAS